MIGDRKKEPHFFLHENKQKEPFKCQEILWNKMKQKKLFWAVTQIACTLSQMKTKAHMHWMRINIYANRVLAKRITTIQWVNVIAILYRPNGAHRWCNTMWCMFDCECSVFHTEMKWRICAIYCMQIFPSYPIVFVAHDSFSAFAWQVSLCTENQ